MMFSPLGVVPIEALEQSSKIMKLDIRLLTCSLPLVWMLLKIYLQMHLNIFVGPYTTYIILTYVFCMDQANKFLSWGSPCML